MIPMAVRQMDKVITELQEIKRILKSIEMDLSKANR
jgi:hypothetical protein